MHLLVTAGPTREPIDPIRFVSNRSSGQMGYELARAAAALGHAVRLIHGPTSLPPPDGIPATPVVTTQEMLEAVQDALSWTDCLIMAAAPCDWRPVAPAGYKLKKADGPPVLHFEPTPDILRTIAPRKRPDQRFYGFAAETDALEAEALRKLAAKHLDGIFANDVSSTSSGMASPCNQVTLYRPGEPPVVSPLLPKTELAPLLLSWILPR